MCISRLGMEKGISSFVKGVSLTMAIMLVFSYISFAYALEYELKYDNNGNLIEDKNNNYEYDSLNQLTKVKDSNNNTISEYFYDDAGSRIKKINYPTNTTTYYVDENFIRIVNSSGTYDTVYYYANGQLVAREENGKKFYYQPDQLGSTNIVTDEIGNIVEKTEYEPFGQVISGGNDRYTFTGQEKDAESGLMYYNARYYSPLIFHFTQPDTVIQNIYNPQNLNRYSYVNNNPLTYNDPTGHFWHIAAGAIIGAVVGAAAYAINTMITGSDFSWKNFGISAGVGAIAGAVGAATFGATFAALGATTTGGAVLAGAGAGTVSGVAAGEAGLIAGSLASGNANQLTNPIAHAEAIAWGGGLGMITGAIAGGIIGGKSGGTQQIPINRLYGHATDDPVNIFRQGAKTDVNNPVLASKIGNDYLIHDGVGRSTRALANGQSYVNAKVITQYESMDELLVRNTLGDPKAMIDKWWIDTAKPTKIDDPARWINWPTEFRSVMPK